MAKLPSGSLTVIAVTDEPIVRKSKGNKMTTENSNTDTAAVMTPKVMAERFVGENFSAVIAEELAKQYEEIAELKLSKERLYNQMTEFRSRWATLHDKVEEFLKSHVKEDDDATVEELKELADNLNIEMSKNIKVTFTIEVTAEMEVDLDFDEESIDETKFDVSIDYNGEDNAEIEWTTDDFDVEEM